MLYLFYHDFFNLYRTKAIKYIMAPLANAILNPYSNAISNTVTEPNTDAIPFTAKAQSTKFPILFTPLGNGIPSKNPAGAISKIVSVILPIKFMSSIII